ncbi:hypothetical protein QBC36DRAFT_126752 [Triangularia setosa]|uniref:Gpi-anchored protein n=1 Tax=Triangularia setosa TaxID=2587417 RepID=A0AAN7A863_9PEZI|nr:hypothetical protein QBC36DRAFT_126752 [Podospora setosa]
MKTRRSVSLIAPFSTLLLTLTAASSVYANLQPFQPAETAAIVAKRQQGCLSNFYSCANQGPAFNGVCCQNGQTCGLDANNEPACCPAGVICTGTAPASFATPLPAATTAVSYVPNGFFSFPYVATYFANREHCSAAARQCDTNYEACQSQLQGLAGGVGYAVTIAVPGGGGTTVTAAAGITYEPARATSICSSLSSVACNGLEPGMCTMEGTTANGFYFGSGNAAPRPTAAAVGVVGAVAAGVAGLNLMNGF